MHPELFRIPFTSLTVKSYGVMMVLGFITAIYIIRKLSRGMGENAEHVTTAALYSLIAGVVGSRLFYVVHYWQQFTGRNFWDIFAVWQGGLELLGGVILAIVVIACYLKFHKLPVRKYLDILAVGLMAALALGRIGCFLNGCCFGSPAENCALSVTFGYDSLAYNSQVRPDEKRKRAEPYIDLPAEYFGYLDSSGIWFDAPVAEKYQYSLKPFDMLTDEQKYEVAKGKYKPLAVHPTQLYESFMAAIGCALLYLHRLKGIKFQKCFDDNGTEIPFLFRNGSTFGFLFIIYGTMRFFLEYFRDDNPVEFDGFTISQNLSIILFAISVILLIAFGRAAEQKSLAK